jgi:hypothetical protein
MRVTHGIENQLIMFVNNILTLFFIKNVHGMRNSYIFTYHQNNKSYEKEHNHLSNPFSSIIIIL